MEQTPRTESAVAPTAPAGWSEAALDITFQEYQHLMDGTDRATDRRQTVNTLFVSINALFLTGVGYLLLQFLQGVDKLSPWSAALFCLGFLLITLITRGINSAWLKLSEQNRRLIDLRIRYLKQLEAQMRAGAAFFPPVRVTLKSDEVHVDAVTTTDVDGKAQNVLSTRGVYSLEDALYGNPNPKKQPFGFTKAEQQIGRTLSLAYWSALGVSIFAYAVTHVVQVLTLLQLHR